jgi:catechol-2,3-dioxygenase
MLKWPAYPITDLADPDGGGIRQYLEPVNWSNHEDTLSMDTLRLFENPNTFLKLPAYFLDVPMLFTLYILRVHTHIHTHQGTFVWVCI